MTDSETLPRGLCLHCDALVYPGRDCLVRPGGHVSHRGCFRLNRTVRRERLVLIAVFSVVLLALAALLVVTRG